jgi:hypothetical protein
MRNRIRRTRFHAIPAKNTARIIDVVDAGVPLSRRNSAGVRVLGCFDVNAICRTRRSAQKTTDTLFQPVFVAMQHMNPAISRLEVDRLVRVVLRDRLPEHVPEGHAEALGQRCKRLAYFTENGWHTQQSNKRRCMRQIPRFPLPPQAACGAGFSALLLSLDERSMLQ